MLPAGAVSGAGLKVAFFCDEPMPLPARGVGKALRPVRVDSGLCVDVATLDKGELDDTRGITAAETIASVLIARTNSSLTVGFELTKGKSECRLSRRRCMMSSPMYRLRAAFASRHQIRF